MNKAANILLVDMTCKSRQIKDVKITQGDKSFHEHVISKTSDNGFFLFLDNTHYFCRVERKRIQYK